MPQRILKNIYEIDIPLPGNPLKAINCYVIKAEHSGKSLLIDTGFNMPECRNALLSGMSELGLSPENTDVFLSHHHTDHIGNAGMLWRQGSRILMGCTDYKYFCSLNWDKLEKYFLREGFTVEEWDFVTSKNPAKRYVSTSFDAESVDDGEILHYGGLSLRCVHTPGHTSGHMCLYCESEKLIFCGDHILFDISPNICSVSPDTNMLGEYLTSLEKLKAYSIEIALPAHRSIGKQSIYSRIDELMTHHAERLNETEALVLSHAGVTAYDIAGLLHWNVTTRSWSEFPPSQKWFAMSEALAHLDYLRSKGVIYKKADADGIFRYYGSFC